MPLFVASTLGDVAEVSKTVTEVSGKTTKSLFIQLNVFATASLKTDQLKQLMERFCLEDKIYRFAANFKQKAIQ